MQTEQTLKGLADYAAGKYYQDKEFLANFTKEYLERANVEDYVMDGQRVSNRTI